MLKKYYKLLLILILPLWVFASFVSAQFVVMAVLRALSAAGVSFIGVNLALSQTLLSVLVYLLTLIIVVGAPWLIRKKKTSLTDIGLNRLPSWTEILITPAGLIVYLILSALLILVVSKVAPGFDINQSQEVGFGQLNYNYEYLLAFVTLVVLAPLAEEILFRGYLLGKLKKNVPVWVAVIVTSITFGAIHGAWNLAVDTFALSIVLCSLRLVTGSIWPSFLLHATKNGIAFYILFINPSLLVKILG